MGRTTSFDCVVRSFLVGKHWQRLKRFGALGLVAFGEARYGEREAIVEAEDWEGPDYGTSRNAAVVARAFETVTAP
jgi:hypothetical protein